MQTIVRIAVEADAGRRTLGELIKARREFLDLTQVELEEISGVPQRTISRIESNRTEGYLPQPHILRAIAKGLRLPTRDLLAAAGYGEDEADDVPDIDLDDPALSFFTSHGGELTDEEKQAVIEVARIIIRNKQRAQREG